MSNDITHPANRLGFDYEAEAAKLPRHNFPITDIHCHLGGVDAVRVYKRVAERYGVGLSYSMTQPDEMDAVRDVLGDAVRFIAIPDYFHLTSAKQLGEGYARRIQDLYKRGVRIAKFWSAPRRLDREEKLGLAGAMQLDSPYILEAMAAAADLGMVVMVHISDPDTWFATKYADASRYGTKRSQYEPLEIVLERFRVPFIAAHMGGWPEDLGFLSRLLARHGNLYLDTSATKWMVRELSRHPRATFVQFLERWKGRILFGSDIVTSDKHLAVESDGPLAGDSVRGEVKAFDMYASRYWALRTLFETDYVGESPIADPDLEMVEPSRYDAMSAPQLCGFKLPEALLRTLMYEAADKLLGGKASVC